MDTFCPPNSCELVEDSVIVITFSTHLNKERWFEFVKDSLYHPVVPDHYSVVLDLRQSTETYTIEELEERARFWLSFRPQLVKFAVVAGELVADHLLAHYGAILQSIRDPLVNTDGSEKSNFAIFVDLDKAIQWVKRGATPKKQVP